MKALIFLILLEFSLNANMNIVCKKGIMDNNSAKKYITKLLKKEPKNIECILKLADVHLKNGEILKGYKYIARAYKINPKAVKDSEIANILSFALEMTDLEKRAKKNKDEFLWNELGDNFFDMGVYEETINAYKNSLALDKYQEKIGLKLALSYNKSDQTHKAVEQLKLLLQLNSKNFYANYYLAKILRYSSSDEGLIKAYFREAKKLLVKQKDNFDPTQYPHFMYDITSELGK